MSVRITNPTLISMQMNRTYDRFGMETVHITVGHRVRNKGVTSIIVSIPFASLRCQSVSFTVTIHCTCPPTKRLHFVYDPPVTAEEFLHSWPKNRKNQSLLTLLEVNYRPPSKLGISIPLTNNVYNADPSKPRLNDHYQASKDSGFLKQCAGKASKEECGCTDEMRLSSLELFTDCRERVYRITYTEKLYPLLKIQERGKEDQVLRAPYLLTVKELNDREDYIVEAAEVIYLADIAKRVGLSAEDIHSPDNLVFKFLATQLYHFRMTVIDGFSYCTLEDEFQIYVDRAPLPGLSQMIIFATVSILMGGVVFVIYLNYLRKTDMPDSHRTRSMIKYYDD
ncbi:cation channel sperm-associated auxiliary subunit beta-like [Diadema setosum]|uniref:cation channel sperm-associated auxiliary subunit beta-like n=1 Tax=Diadema setosum TaxID=31175 RepID=UPI003B3BAE20